MRSGLGSLLAIWLCLQSGWLCAQSMLERPPRRKPPAWAVGATWEGRESLLRFTDDLWRGNVDNSAAEEPSPLLFLPESEEDRAAAPKVQPLVLPHEDLNQFSAESHTQALLDTVAELGLDTGWQRSTRRLSQAAKDEVSLTDVNLMVRLLEEKQLQWRVGIGMQVLDHERDFYLGYAFTTALNLCISEQFAISAQGELGRVDSAGIRHGRATVGLTNTRLPNLEVYSGFDFFEIGAERYQEPVLGLRFKF